MFEIFVTTCRPRHCIHFGRREPRSLAGSDEREDLLRAARAVSKSEYIYTLLALMRSDDDDVRPGPSSLITKEKRPPRATMTRTITPPFLPLPDDE